MDEKKIKLVDTALAEAERFIQRASAWRKVLRSDISYQSKEGGAAKRSSLDLTRALADLRRGRT